MHHLIIAATTFLCPNSAPCVTLVISMTMKLSTSKSVHVCVCVFICLLFIYNISVCNCLSQFYVCLSQYLFKSSMPYSVSSSLSLYLSTLSQAVCLSISLFHCLPLSVCLIIFSCVVLFQGDGWKQTNICKLAYIYDCHK